MKIQFKAFYEDAIFTDHKPVPAKNKIPDWFSKLPKFIDEDKKFKFFSNGNANTTLKFCSPFLDSLTAGYCVLLENDIFVGRDDSGEQYFSWARGGENFIVNHLPSQISPKMIPKEFNPMPFKFQNKWSTITPKGYSTLFIHPLNRTDLPFHTLSGFVDSDDYHIPVEFPFLLKADFEGVIPAGTPVAQAIPIKREPWIAQIDKFDPEFTKKKNSSFFSKIYRPYKNLFWKRKDYR
jgi:hypothetical protein